MVKNQKRIEQIAGIALISAILVGCGVVLKPFTLAILWAAILCFATWPVYELLLKWLRGRRNLAAGIMTVVLLLVLFVPFFVVGLTFTDSIQSAMEWLNTHRQASVPPPPAWAGKIPIVGAKITAYWSKLAANAEPAMNFLKPWVQKAGLWLLQHSLDFAQGVLQLAISVLIAFFLYRDGVGIVVQLREGFRRLSGDYSQHMMDVAKITVQSVVYGLIGTALVQSVTAGIGFGIAGVPSPVLLALFTFFLSFIPFGPVIIWLGAAIWLFSGGHTGWGIFMVIYGALVISSIDNFVKPYIISRGSKLPFIVMFIGILGGIATFGLIGVFLGPTLLTVGYCLTKEILSHRRDIRSQKSADKPEDIPLDNESSQ
ncbi:MAG: AI-2E family transporter [Phycisphaerae bacterium]|jgi:predicted PurR-regulated permease PerM